MKKSPIREKSPAQTKQAQDRPTATVTNEEKGFWFRYPYTKEPVFIQHPNPDELSEKGKETFAFSVRFKNSPTGDNEEKGFWYRQPFRKEPVFIPHPHPEKLSHGDLAGRAEIFLEDLNRGKLVSPYPFPNQTTEKGQDPVKEKQKIPGSGFFYKPKGAACFYFIPNPDEGDIPETHEEQRAYGAKWLSTPVGMLAERSLIEEREKDILSTHIQCITESIDHILLSNLDNENPKDFQHIRNGVMYLTRLANYYNNLLLD